MKTLNLFKSIKNISYLTAFACLPLSSAYGEHTPQEIIEAYANDQTLLGTESLAGNVLAYKNIEGKTVVLKSGTDFTFTKKKEEKDVIVVSLEDVLKYTGDNIYNFGKSAINHNDDWYKHIQSEFPFKRDKVESVGKNQFNSTQQLILTKTTGEQVLLNFSFNGKDNISYNHDKNKKEVSWEPLYYIERIKSEERDGKFKTHDLQSQLDKFRHTEIQIQALWNKYNDLKTQKRTKKKFDPCDPRNELGEKQQETENFIKKLLPITLIDPSNTEIDHNIYSLFEACNACRQTKWLQSKKDIFMFKVADGQVIKKTIINKETGEEESVRYRKSTGFMSQEDLESNIEKPSKEDTETQLKNNGFEEITQPKQVSSSTVWE